LDGFAVAAAATGWSAADLFGICPDKPHWGGIADRLRGARSLAIGADVASWRHGGIAEQYARGVCPWLAPLWEVMNTGANCPTNRGRGHRLRARNG
ncbi:MAG: hypothetical protein KGK11_11800, partial [Sphingomonadales bacterium]|nr:hypothetical protein [Sphingomonadales bacterium]